MQQRHHERATSSPARPCEVVPDAPGSGFSRAAPVAASFEFEGAAFEAFVADVASRIIQNYWRRYRARRPPGCIFSAAGEHSAARSGGTCSKCDRPTLAGVPRNVLTVLDSQSQLLSPRGDRPQPYFSPCKLTRGLQLREVSSSCLATVSDPLADAEHKLLPAVEEPPALVRKAAERSAFGGDGDSSRGTSSCGGEDAIERLLIRYRPAQPKAPAHHSPRSSHDTAAQALPLLRAIGMGGALLACL